MSHRHGQLAMTGLLLFLTGSGLLAQHLSFRSRRDYPAGFSLFGPYSPNPDGIALGDLNHDGNPDVVTANFGDSVSVLLGIRNGTFAAAAVYPSSPCQISTSVAVADFNGDGKLDLMVNDTFKGNQVCLLSGNGDGTFQAAQSIPVSGLVNWLATSDVNGDGKSDLILATNADVSILLGNGNGTFGAPINLGVGPASYLASADFNHDGHPDIAALSSASFGNPVNLFIFLGNGDGTFHSSSQITFAKGASSLALGDVNSDKKVDIAVAANPDLMVLLGNGDGTFTSPLSVGSIGAYGLEIGDVNGDGKNDIVATATQMIDNFPQPVIAVLIGKGNGTFHAPSYYEADSTPSFLALGDFNQDHRLDIVCSDNGAGITVLLNAGRGGFEHSKGYPAAKHSNFISAGDLNGDGLPDLIVTDANDLQHRIAVLLNKGHGAFGQPAIMAAPATPTSPVALGDFNGDGKLDYAINVTNSSSFTGAAVALGNGDGTFQTAKMFAVPLTANNLVSGDFNHDGKLDLAVGNGAKSTAEISVLLGKGDGTFQPALNSALPAVARAIAAGDFNGDGNLDIASVSQQGQVSLSLGNGDGTFQAAKTFQLGVNISSLAAVSLRGKGLLDLAFVSHPGTLSGARVLVALGNGDGTFQSPTSWFAGWAADQIIAGDFNGDGKQDLAISNSALLSSNPSDADVGILLGNGDGTFQPVELFGTAGQPRGLAAVDVNADGRLDIVTGCDVVGACILLNATK